MEPSFFRQVFLLVYPDKAKALPWEKNVLTPSRSYLAAFYREANAIDEERGRRQHVAVPPRDLLPPHRRPVRARGELALETGQVELQPPGVLLNLRLGERRLVLGVRAPARANYSGSSVK